MREKVTYKLLDVEALSQVVVGNPSSCSSTRWHSWMGKEAQSWVEPLPSHLARKTGPTRSWASIHLGTRDAATTSKKVKVTQIRIYKKKRWNSRWVFRDWVGVTTYLLRLCVGWAVIRHGRHPSAAGMIEGLLEGGGEEQHVRDVVLVSEHKMTSLTQSWRDEWSLRLGKCASNQKSQSNVN